MNKHEPIPDSEKNEASAGTQIPFTDRPMDAKAFIESIMCPVSKSFMEAESPAY